MRFTRGEDWPALAVFAAAAILITPLWITSAPAMPDYPAHLATFYMIAGGIKDPALAHFYRIEWGFIPNLAAELLVPALGRFVGLVAAVKLFLSAAVAMWVLGPAFIHRTLFGRFGLSPLFAAFFAYNANFMWGFLNYYFGAGLALAVFAAWMAADERNSLLRLALFSLAATVIYFCHLFALALLGFLIVVYEAGKFWERRAVSLADVLKQYGRIFAIFIPAAIFFLFLRPAAGAGGDNRLEFNLLDTFQDRLDSFILFHFDQPAYLLLAALILFVGMSIWRGWMTFHPRMTMLLSCLALLVLFAPEWAMGGWGVDMRLPAIFGALVFASAEFNFAPRASITGSAAILVVLAFTAAALAGNWRYYDTRYDEFRAASKSIPRGSRIVTVLDGDAIGMASDQPYWHLAEFAIIDRSAFTPLLFATRGQHVVYINPPYDKWAAATAKQGSPPDISEIDDLEAGAIDDDPDIKDVFPYLVRLQCHFDSIVVIHLGGMRSPLPDNIRLRRERSFFSIYDLNRTKECPGRRVEAS